MIYSEIHIPSTRTRLEPDELEHELSHNFPLLEAHLEAPKFSQGSYSKTLKADTFFQNLYMLREQQKGIIFGNRVEAALSSLFNESAEKSKPWIEITKPIQDKMLSPRANSGTVSSTRPKTRPAPWRILPEDTIIYNDALKFKNRVRFNRTHDWSKLINNYANFLERF